jgi:hypothetical protein
MKEPNVKESWVGYVMAKLNLQKHGKHTSYANKTSQSYFGPISVIPSADLFFGVDGLSPAVVEPDHSNHPSGCSFLADPPYRHSDAFRYPNINIHMWHCDWFYSIT